VQGHLDMVCVAAPGTIRDFSTDPIVTTRNGDWVEAVGTTLGADNGVGAAMALALLTTPELAHGPLELIFTVEEEVGLVGAAKLDSTLVHATSLINLDSENPDEITIGCAGGASSIVHLAVDRVPASGVGVSLAVSGLTGGHSGVEIHKGNANAIKLLAQVLIGSVENGVDYGLSSISGGTASNVIPTSAIATLVLGATDADEGIRAIQGIADAVAETWRSHEPNISIEAVRKDVPNNMLTTAHCDDLTALLAELPYGVRAMSNELPDVVETSSNLAKIADHGDEIEITVSSRSLDQLLLRAQQQTIAEICASVGATVDSLNGYPNWKPDAQSAILESTKKAYRQAFGKEPIIRVVHAGLECGVLIANNPGLKQAVSFGPSIPGAHTVDERVEIKSVDQTWKLLITLLANMCQSL
jgi:dipeptidase D